MILRGIFLLRRRELDWFYQDGCNWLYPEAYESFARLVPEADRGDIIAAYYKRLTDPDPRVHIEAARTWSIWEGSTLALLPDAERIRSFGQERYALAFARIECHYFVNNAFFDTDNYLIENVGKIRHIPGVIVQGRYDVVCPMMSAWDLHRAWPEAELKVIPDAGHSATEPGIIDALVDATDRFRR